MKHYTLEDWVVTISSIIAILTAVVVIVRHFIKTETAQLRNNGGSTLKDSVDRQERVNRETLAEVKEIGRQLTEHLIAAAAKDATQDEKIAHLEERG